MRFVERSVLMLGAASIAASRATQENAPSQRCGAVRQPKIAVCLAGGARTFAMPGVYERIGTNMIAALEANVTTFLHLKLIDHSDKGGTAVENIAHGVHHADEVATRHAARAIGGALGALDIVSADEGLYPRPMCAHGGGTVPNFTDSHMSWKLQEHWQMLIAQIDSLRWCGDAIAAYELRTGVQFEYVIKSRPDLTPLTPLWPHCEMDLEFACQSRDWMFMLPGRAAIPALRKGWERFQSCAKETQTLSQGTSKMPIAESLVRGGMGAILSPREKEKMPGQRPDINLRLQRVPGAITGSPPGTIRGTCGW